MPFPCPLGRRGTSRGTGGGAWSRRRRGGREGVPERLGPCRRSHRDEGPPESPGRSRPSHRHEGPGPPGLRGLEGVPAPSPSGQDVPAPSPSGPHAALPAVAEIERALTRLTRPGTRTRHHDRLRAPADVPLDRAAVALPRQFADREPMRPGEVAHRFGVDALPVTRTVRSSSGRGTSPGRPTPTTGVPGGSGPPERVGSPTWAGSPSVGPGRPAPARRGSRPRRFTGWPTTSPRTRPRRRPRWRRT